MKSARSTGDLKRSKTTQGPLGSKDTPEGEEEGNQLEIGQFIGEKAGVLSNLMSGSNGRDKICALVQYSVQLYTVCMRHSHDA